MTDPVSEFLPRVGAGPDLADALTVLQPMFRLEPARPCTVRRIWLDTFDRRLHRAGLVLAETVVGGQRRLVLHEAPPGPAISVPAPALNWPALADALPPGAVRQRLTAVSGIRALLPIARWSGRQREIRVLNADGKTVTRLRQESTAGGGCPDRLVVLAVRGYQAQADRVTRLLATAPTLEPAAASAYEQAVRITGEQLAPPEPITPAQPAAAAIGSVLHAMLDAVRASTPGTIADIDTEFLHDVRVAVRRARSVLKLTGDVLPPEVTTELAAELRWLGDVTSPTRDLDVYLLGVPAMARGLRSAEPGDLDEFGVHLAQRRRIERRRLVRALRSKRFASLVGLWQSVPRQAPHDGPTASALAAERVRRAHRRVVRLGSAITVGSPAEDLHTLRKRCKELRYLLEIFEPCYDRTTHRQAMRTLRSLQDCLGRFQDNEVQADGIGSFAAEMMAAGTAGPRTLLAMGDLAAALRVEQQRARAEFAGEFAAFVRPKNRLLAVVA